MDESLFDEMRQVEESHWWFLGRRRIVDRLVGQHAPDCSLGTRLRLCELGCGCGGNLARWAKQYDVQGLECAPLALDYARKRLGSRIKEGSLPDQVPFSNSSFDIVIMTDVLEHIENDDASVDRAMQLLRPGGIFVATVPAYQFLYSPRDKKHHHFRRYSKSRFRNLFDKPGVRVELLSHYNSFLFAPAAVVRLMEKAVPRCADGGDLKIPSKRLNSLLTKVFSSEYHLLNKLTLPFGLSLVVVARNVESQHRAVAA